MASSPTQRTLAYLSDQGWLAQVVEKWIPQVRRRVDLFGIGDVLAVNGEQTLLVQTTSTSNMGARMKKSEEDKECRANLLVWMLPGRVFEVWGWAKRGPRGKRKLWTLKRVRAYRGPGDFGPPVVWERIG